MINIAIIGCGGHAKIILDIIDLTNNYLIVGFYDDIQDGFYCNYPILGTTDKLGVTNKLDTNIDGYIIAIGNDNIRFKIYNRFPTLNWITIIHPTAIISKKVKIGEGTVICAGAIIQTEVNIGKQCIINTGCSIDHECNVGDFCSICPNAVLCGMVRVDNLSFIGSNSTIIQSINIGSGCIIGAGCVVLRNVVNNSKIVGNPGKCI